MIQIHRLELEAIILERLHSGGYESVEDVLTEALAYSELRPNASSLRRTGPTGPEILTAFRRSPHKEIDIVPASYVLPISEPVEF